MSTNASISVEYADGSVQMIYLHFDGHEAGEILKNHYGTYEAAVELIEQGDASYIAPRLAPLPGEKHSFNDPADGVCVFYRRDRPQRDSQNKPALYDSVMACKAACARRYDFNYLFSDGCWHLNGRKI